MSELITDAERAQKIIEQQMDALIANGEDVHGVRTLLIEIARQIANTTVPKLDVKIARRKGYEIADEDKGEGTRIITQL